VSQTPPKTHEITRNTRDRTVAPSFFFFLHTFIPMFISHTRRSIGRLRNLSRLSRLNAREATRSRAESQWSSWATAPSAPSTSAGTAPRRKDTGHRDVAQDFVHPQCRGTGCRRELREAMANMTSLTTPDVSYNQMSGGVPMHC
jgi:hypothetical protein